MKKQSKQSKTEKKATAIHADAAKKINAAAEAGKLQTPPVKPVERFPDFATAGKKYPHFPKNSNAVKVETADGKTVVVMRGNEDTLKGVQIKSYQFGKVPNDAKGHPMRDKFTADSPNAVPPAAKTTTPSPKAAKATAAPPTPSVCGYPGGTLRAVIATEGLKGWKDDKALVEAVRKTLPKFTSEQVARCLKLVSDPKHAFNGGNTEVRTGTDGTKRIVALKPAAVATPTPAAPAK